MNRNLLSDIYCLDCFIAVRKHIKANEKTFQALTHNIEQPRPWKPHTYHFSNHPRTITFYLCFASCLAMPFWEIHLLWLPWQGKRGCGGCLVGFCLQAGFSRSWGGRRTLLDLNNSLMNSFGSMFLQVWGVCFFVFLPCPWLVSKRFINAEINYYTCKCWSKHQEMPWPWRLTEPWKEALNTQHTRDV